MMLKVYPDDYQLHLFHDGSYFKSYEIFGAKIVSVNEVEGVSFTVWAPHAKVVQVVGDFNHWDGNQHEMKKVNNEGVWDLFIPYVKEGDLYKYKIITEENKELLKADPYGVCAEVRPNTASIVYSLEGYKWNDRRWVKGKEKKNHLKEALNIYELHMGSWKKKESNVVPSVEAPIESFYTYKEMADQLIPYVKERKFTHIEVMPLVEHPYDPSWGYQGTGYYAVTSRYGTPQDFMYFVDQCHQNGIGVIMDWVPGHFCKDAHGLSMFDGKPTYEYENMSVRESSVWGTANFDLGKTEVQSYLISNALFWLEYFHIDGFRVDAVANMLYWELDGKWQRNEMAVQFLQKLNETIALYYPQTMICAEDSTDWPLVTSPPSYEGLGFHYKWNMGWMNDILSYMKNPFEERKHAHHNITFSLLYAFSENFILPLSHDEVVHGKKSLLNKMPGDYWQQFAQLRLLYGYMFAHPGKKLLFMGGEFGQFDEWKDKEELDWMLLDFDMHQKMDNYTKDLFSLYKRSKSLWQLDQTSEGFQWIDADNNEQSIVSFIRKGEKEDDFLVIVCNFTPQVYHQYKIGVPKNEYYNETFNSDDVKYGGSGQVNKKKIKSVHASFHNQPNYVEITIPPLGATILRPVKQRKGSSKNEEVRSNVIGRRARKSTKGTDEKLS